MKKIGIYFVVLTGICALASLAAAQDAALVQAARKEGLVVWHTSVALPTATVNRPRIQAEIYGNRSRGPSLGIGAGTAKSYAGSGGGNKERRYH